MDSCRLSLHLTTITQQVVGPAVIPAIEVRFPKGILRVHVLHCSYSSLSMLYDRHFENEYNILRRE